MDTLLVLTNLPDKTTAEQLAALLIEQRLAACVNLLPTVRSVYRWQGAIEQAEEVPLLIKTAAGRFEALCTAIRSHHPYQLPEIIALPIVAGLPDYLAWVATETRPKEADEQLASQRVPGISSADG